jgi:hypothetical protein
MPDVDLEQTGGTNVAVDETFTAAKRIQLDSTSRAAITSAVESSRLVDPTLALHVLLAVISTSHMRNVPSRESTWFVAHLTWIVIVRVDSYRDMGPNPH